MEVAKRRYSIDSNNRYLYDLIEGESSFLKNHKDVFLLALVLGYNNDKRESLKKKENILFHTGLFDDDSSKAIYNSIKIIAGSKSIDEQILIEEYANGGIKILEKYIDISLNKFLEDEFINAVIEEISSRSLS